MLHARRSPPISAAGLLPQCIPTLPEGLAPTKKLLVVDTEQIQPCSVVQSN